VRPLTFQTIINTLKLINIQRYGDPDEIAQIMKWKPTRAREVLKQLHKMSFIEKKQSNMYILTPKGKLFLNYYIKGSKEKLHAMLLETLDEYRIVYEYLKKYALTKEELRKLTGLSPVVIDVVLRLMAHVLPNLVKDQQGKYYVQGKRVISYKEFLKALKEEYQKLRRGPFGTIREYVPIDDLRDGVCKRLRISGRLFDTYLYPLISEGDKNIELVQAPSTLINERWKGYVYEGRRFYFIRIYDMR